MPHRKRPEPRTVRLLEQFSNALNCSPHRHARACPAHPRLTAAKAWVAGTSPAMTSSTPLAWHDVEAARAKLLDETRDIRATKRITVMRGLVSRIHDLPLPRRGWP